MRKMKRVEDSRTENTYLIMNKHINSYGRLFGGVLMQWIDEMAGIVAHRHAGTIVTTACVDNLNFKAGAYLGMKFRLLKIQEIKNCVMFLPENPINSLQSSVLVQQIMKTLFWTILPDYAMFRRK